jgi:serine/threonine protein kinase/tetratricopeptide (TPR) repeat protein
MTEDSIFAAALKKPPAERAAYLDEACAGDPALRAEVEALLRAHAEAGSGLQQPLVEEEASPAVGESSPQPDTGSFPTERTGVRIAPYKLLQQIGEGGMGVVYMAEQEEPVRRQVALKIIKPGMDSAQVIARFEAERQALALMDHPNIARVLDAGTTDSGRPFFVMELVKGIPLTRFCDERRLSPRERLELAVPVCQAVQHAHQKGVIHRDLKPSNILVALYDGRPVPKVIDFGVAKATGPKLTERTLFTAFGAVVGTLEYMAPEQAEVNQLDVDTRADIYSLGVLLYELLTGSTPLERGRLKKVALAEVFRLIREQEPPRPSARLSSSERLASVAASRGTEPAKLTKLVRGELDWIVMKCLEKDRERRYETANGLARDLQRYLADEPVQASPPSARYRLRKFVRKHRAALLTAAAFAVLLVAGVVVSTWQAVRARQAEVRALAERDQKDEQRRRAKTNLDRAIRAIDQMLIRADEQRLGHIPQFYEERRKILEDALALYQGLLDENSGEPEIRLQTGRAHERMGDINRLLGRHQEAEQAYTKAHGLLGPLTVEYPAVPEYQFALAQTYSDLGSLYFNHTKRMGEAEATSVKGLAVVRHLTHDHPLVPEYQLQLAVLLHDLGRMYGQSRRHSEAETAFLQAVDTTKQLNQLYPGVSEYHYREATIRYELAVMYRETGRIKESEEAFLETLACHKLAARDVANPKYQYGLALCYNQLGALYRRTSRFKEAQAGHDEALALFKSLTASHPTVPDFASNMANTYIFLGNLYRATARFAEAQQADKQALALRRDLAATYPTVREYQEHLALCLSNLARSYGGVAQYTEVELTCQEAITILKVLTRDHPTIAQYQQILAGSYDLLALSYKKMGRAKEAEDTYRDAWKIREKLVADSPSVSDYQSQLGGTLVDLALLLSDRAEFATARRLLQQALPHHQAALKGNPQNSLYRQFYRSNLSALTQSCAGERDQAAAVEAATKLRDLSWNPPGNAYNAACALAHCIPILEKDEKASNEERSKQVQFYGDQAMAMLRDAVAKGYKDAAHMKKDTDLDPLRSREDFKKLVADLEAAAKP